MARTFVAASLQSLSIASASVTNTPYTLRCKFNADVDTTNQALMSLGGSADANQRIILRAKGDDASLDPVEFSVRGGGGANDTAQTTTSFVVATWYSGIGVSVSATDRSAFINGGSEGTNTVSITHTGIDAFKIAQSAFLTGTTYFDGDIADASVYNAALTDNEAAAVHYCSLLIKPESLLNYYPLGGLYTDDNTDLVGTADLTANNAPTSSQHPHMIYPCDPQMVIKTVAAGGSTGGGAYHHMQNLGVY